MNDIEWYFPESIEEAATLLAQGRVAAHGGGTSLLRGASKQAGGLIELSRLPLSYFEEEQGQFRFGAGRTYAEVVSNLTALDPAHILVQSLGRAASTPLRNRITLGVSVALFPVWSDLMGPLLALDAAVELTGTNRGTYPLERYQKDRGLRRNSLITSVRFERKHWRAWYHRETRTHFDYPAFTITILSDKEPAGDLRILVTGNTGKYARLLMLEQAVGERGIEAVLRSDWTGYVELDFARKRLGNAAYIKHLALVGLERGLKEVERWKADSR